MTNEHTVRHALANVLTNVINYPEDVQALLLGLKLNRVIDAAVAAVMDTGLVEKVDTMHSRPEVTRVEVIDNSGRAYTQYGASDVSTSLQDGGATLKVFLRSEQ